MLFEFRLGLALGKFRHEIRNSLSYPEFKRWQAYSLLEPFGFEDREYRTSALMAQMYNVQVHKKSQLKKFTTWMRDTSKTVVEFLEKELHREEVGDFDLSTPEGRAAATQEVLKNFRMLFGETPKGKR